MSDITLTSSMRANLSSLRMISGQMGKTQERLSTGLKVNSAIDNASSYYQARSLTNRAADLAALLDNMGQGIQTINAAIEGLESGTAFLEQMSSIAAQAVAQPAGGSASGDVSGGDDDSGTVTKPIEDFINEGYQVINAGATADEIEALIADGAKLVLDGDVILDRGLNITNKDVIINGNGHKITFTGDNAAAITVDGATASADISNVKIEATGENVVGIKATNGGAVTFDSKNNIAVSGTGAQKVWYRDEKLYDGKGNTKAIIDQIGAAGLAATAANQFYAPGIAQNDADFGQGNWYLPSIGELMDLYGTDTQAMTGSYGTSGATGENKALVNAALAKLGGDAAQLSNGYYWSSSENNDNFSWGLDMISGARGTNAKNIGSSFRIFQHLENCFYPFNSSEAASGSEGTGGMSAPQIGDVMYSDKTWGSADDYAAAKAAGKIAVGIVCDVNEGDGSVKIVNLKDLKFSSASSQNNFNPDNPYTGSTSYCYWSANYTDITGIDNYNGTALLPAMKSSGKITFTNETASGGTGSGTGTDDSTIADSSAGIDRTYQEQFNTALNEYDKLIADTSYQGINLLKGGKLSVTFNETRSHRFTVQGQDMTAAALGLNTADWATIADAAKSLDNIVKALDTIRGFQAELGNNYQIIQTRQNFTGALVDVLETGSDNLTLADMNEESANYLALQTRQHLAINSLSLAAQSAQSILSLF